MKKEDLILLAEKISKGTATDQELIQYNTWYNSVPVSVLWDNDLLGDKIEKENLLLKNIELTIKKDKNPQHLLLYRRLAAVAAIFLVLSVGMYFYTTRYNKEEIQEFTSRNDVPAGKNGAILTLANGRKIKLSDAAKGKLAEESGVSITKTTGGQIAYSTIEDAHSNDIKNATQFQKRNTLSTSNGEQYQLILPDQTKVWLNAASSIKYPASFAGSKVREVEITGEVYFEVAKVVRQEAKQIQRVPFIVKTKDQVVEVLGTHFNVNSYADENTVKTTLLEGIVRVSPFSNPGNIHSAILTPGQQSVLNKSGTINVENANLQEVMAWKNGDFVLKNNDFKVLMRKIARWYDVDIIYDQSAPSSLKLVGVVSRSKNISAILKILQATGEVHFTLEGRRVTVTK